MEKVVNTSLLHLGSHCCPFIHRDMHVVPLCSLDDGFSHLITLDSSNSRLSLAKLLLGVEGGTLFKKVEPENTLEIEDDQAELYTPNYDSVPFEYSRLTSFEIRPSDELLELSNQGVKYGQFSIDGEAYPIDVYSAHVINKVLNVYSL